MGKLKNIFILYIFLFICLLNFSSALNNGIGQDGLVVYTSLNNGMFDDFNNYDPIIEYGARNTTFGFLNNSFNHDGVNDCYNFSSNISLNNFSNFIVNIWINPKTNNNKNIVEQSSIFRMRIDTGNTFICRVYNTSQSAFSTNSSSLVNITLNSWQMITCKYNQSHICAYLNGSYESCTAVTGALNVNNTMIAVGKQPPSSNYFNGTTDEFSIWNRTNINLTKLYSDYINGIMPQDSGFRYFANSGSDNEICNLENKPCKTINKSNNMYIVSGDIIAFNRGDKFYLGNDSFPAVRNGTSSNYTIYDAYGVGNAPELHGSLLVTLWTNMGGNIWKTSNSSIDVGHVAFNDNIIFWNKSGSYSSLNSDYMFFHNFTGDKMVYVYSSTDPNTYTTSELAINTSIFDLTNKQNIKISNLTISHSGKHGIGSSGVKNLYTSNNTFKYIGGSNQTSSVRYGNCIEIGQTSNNTIIEYNKIYECYDAGFTIQAWSGAQTAENHIFRYNLILNSTYGIEYFMSDVGSIARNISIHHNTIFNTGLGFGLFDKHTTAMALRFSETQTGTYNLTLRNNLIGNETNRAIVFGNFINNYLAPLDLDYNYYQDGVLSANFADINGTAYTSFSAYKTGTGQDTNGGEVNITFEDIINFQPIGGQTLCTGSSTNDYVGWINCTATSTPTPTPTPTNDFETAKENTSLSLQKMAIALGTIILIFFAGILTAILTNIFDKPNIKFFDNFNEIIIIIIITAIVLIIMFEIISMM